MNAGAAALGLLLDARVIPASAWIPLQQAEQVLQQARTVRDGIEAERAEAMAVGHAEGLRAGRAQARSELALQLQQIETGSQQAWARLQDCALDLAVVLLRRIAPRLGEAALVRAMIEAVLPELQLEPRLRIHVHPDVVETVQACMAEARMGVAGRCTILGEPKLAMTDCLIELQSGILDLGFDTQLAQAREIGSRLDTDGALRGVRDAAA